MTRLTDKVRMLFDGRYFAVLSTLEPDGRPHSTVTWVKRVADDPLVALPRAPSSRALPPSRTTRTAGLVDELSHKYTGGPYPGFAGVRHPQWVVARITADKGNYQLAGLIEPSGAIGSGRPPRPAPSTRAVDPSESGEPPRPRRSRPRPRAPLGHASQPPHAGQTPRSGPH
jgi:hypothetical protein